METWAFVTARALMGIPMAASYVVCPVYTKEISENSIRGILGSLVSGSASKILYHDTNNTLGFIVQLQY